MKAIFLQAVTEVRLSVYKASSKLHYNTRIVLIRTKYTSPKKALQFWSAQSKLHIVLEMVRQGDVSSSTATA